MRRRLLAGFASLVVAALALGCGPTVHLTVDGRVHPALQPASVEARRDHFTRVAEPDGLAIRWVEATLVDPAWVVAEDAEWGRLRDASAEAVQERTRKRLEAYGYGEGIAFEVWVFTQCRHCEELDRWLWALTGPTEDQGDEGPRGRPPTHLEYEVVDVQDQTLAILDASRIVRLRKVRATLRFSGELRPGRMELVGSPGRGFDPCGLVWMIPKTPPPDIREHSAPR